MTENIKIVDDIEIGDIVMYEQKMLLKRPLPEITITLERVVDVGIKNFKNDKSLILKKCKVRKLIRNKEIVEHSGYEFYIHKKPLAVNEHN